MCAAAFTTQCCCVPKRLDHTDRLCANGTCGSSRVSFPDHIAGAAFLPFAAWIVGAGPVACGRGPASATSSCIAAGPMSGYVLSRHALCSTAGCLRATVADAETQCTCRRPDTHGHSAIRATAARQCRRQVSSPEVSKKSGSFRMLCLFRIHPRSPGDPLPLAPLDPTAQEFMR